MGFTLMCFMCQIILRKVFSKLLLNLGMFDNGFKKHFWFSFEKKCFD